jgi:hypothetical protein
MKSQTVEFCPQSRWPAAGRAEVATYHKMRARAYPDDYLRDIIHPPDVGR